MNKEKQIDIIRDLLIEFDEMGFVPSTTVPNPEDYAIKWRAEITKALENYRKQSENVIELPCKVGDTVYVVSQGAGFSVVWNVYKATAIAIYLDRRGQLFIHVETDKENIGGYVEIERVFLTKEEAEEALAKIKGGAE